jgi:hypothetical protein
VTPRANPNEESPGPRWNAAGAVAVTWKGILVAQKPKPVKPAFNERDARRLVELVGDHEGAVMDFRIFAESKSAKARMSELFRAGERLPRLKFRGTLAEHMPKLQAANLKGMGCYYSLNESDGKGVKRANIKAVRVIPVDLDKSAPPDIWPRLLTPHLVMESSPGRHQALFMIEPTTDYDRAADIAKRLALEFGGDPTVFDRSRVFRMPGFLHQKAKPFTSRIVTVQHFEPRHTLARLHKLLPKLPRSFASTTDKGIGIIGVAEAKLLFENMDPECLDGNETWQSFAMALHAACNGCEEVAELFFDFCSTADGYGDEGSDALNRVRWESFSADHEGGVGIGTLRYLCLKFRVPGLVMFQVFNTAKRDFDDDQA